MLVQQFNNKTLPRQLEILMEHIANIHNHFTRTSSNSGLFIPQISSTNFGSYSLKYMAPYVWNTLIYAITIVVIPVTPNSHTHNYSSHGHQSYKQPCDIAFFL